MATDEEKEHLFQAVQVAVDAAVSSVMADHYDALTQEPLLSAKITLAIEHAMDGVDFGDLNVEVKARDFPLWGEARWNGRLAPMSTFPWLSFLKIGKT